jgi:putative ABC transport system substrate-binding protein
MGRRDFITFIGGAAAWPVGVRAQQPAMPVVGYLYNGVPEQNAKLVEAFRKGLSEAGYVEGRNVTIEYRWGHNEQDRLPELVADLVRSQVSVIATPGSLAATLAAKAATTTIPIVFMFGADPVQVGAVASLNRPGGNVTGIASMGTELGAKRLALMHDLLPVAARFGALINSNPGMSAEATTADLKSATSAIGREIEIINIFTARELDKAFESLLRMRADALVISAGPLFLSRNVQLVTLATHHRLPAIYPFRENAEAGGLMSYGPNEADMFRQAGLYTGRILKGEKPADLPVMRANRFEFVINLQTAKAAGIEVPPGLLAIADEVIE